MTKRSNPAVQPVHLVWEGWTVTVTLARDDQTGPWGIQEFACRPPDPSVNGRDMRALPFGLLLARARKQASQEARRADTHAVLAQPSDVALLTFREGKRKRTDRDYAELAVEYALLVQEGERNVPSRLAQQFGGSVSTWTNRITEARKRGMLTRLAARGEAGGTVTAKALAVLNTGRQG